jgi:hypothetical protein
MGITFEAFFGSVEGVINAKLPVLLRSRHGVGKSTVVYQIAERLGKPVIERRASQMTEGDLLGLPKVDGDRTTWLPPDWLKRACEEAVVLFVDEIDRGTPEVRQGFFELTDSRKIAGNFLHKDTVIFAAVNGGEASGQYQVGEMDPAELDRWVVFDLEPSVEDWLSWAKGKVDSLVWDFINQQPSHLEHKGDFEPNKVYPSRRSWVRFNNTVTDGENPILVAGERQVPLFNLATAFLGLEAAVSFQDFVANYARQVTAEDIFEKGNFKLIEKWTLPEHTAFIDKVGSKDYWKQDLTDVQIENLAKYILCTPSEAAVKLWHNVSEGKYENLIKLHKAPGYNIGLRIAEYLGGEVEKKEEPATPAPVAPAPVAVAKKRGRPVGSKNKR